MLNNLHAAPSKRGTDWGNNSIGVLPDSNETGVNLAPGRVILPRRRVRGRRSSLSFGLIVHFGLLLFLKLFLLGVCFVNVSYTFCCTTKV